jgi:hypothetical protein
MNQLVSLLKTLKSLKLNIRSEMPSVDDFQLLIATDSCRLAAHHIRKEIQYHLEFNKLTDDTHQIQLLKMIHNLVIDKNIEQQREYFDSLFDLIQSNAELKPILVFHEFKNSGYKLTEPEHYEKFVKMGRSLNNKAFHNKELIIFFCSKILETHDEIEKLKTQYF